MPKSLSKCLQQKRAVEFLSQETGLRQKLCFKHDTETSVFFFFLEKNAQVGFISETALTASAVPIAESPVAS